MNKLIQKVLPSTLFILSLLLMNSCVGNDPEVEPSARTIEEYISLNNITPEYTSSGLGYIIGNTGNAKRNIDESTVKTEVIVTSTEDRILIDTEGEVYINMLGQVPAIKEGMKLIGEGGKIVLYVPYEIGWGAGGNGFVPAESDVIVEISLESILIDVEDYISENNIETSAISGSDVQVLVEVEGDGSFPSLNNVIEVKYKGYFTNGDVFDENTEGFSRILQELIPGWQEGIPQLSRGGKGKLFVPYESAYGTEGNVSIPGRTDLIFDVELVDFD